MNNYPSLKLHACPDGHGFICLQPGKQTCWLKYADNLQIFPGGQVSCFGLQELLGDVVEIVLVGPTSSMSIFDTGTCSNDKRFDAVL